MKKCFVASVVASALIFSACSSKREIEVIDPGSAQQLSGDFGASDIQLTIDKMVDSLLTSPSVVEITSNRKPVLMVSTIRNKTLQHIDPQIITDSIRSRLIRSGKFRFIDRATDQQLIDEIKYQQESGLVDPTKAQQFGHQSGVEYILTGTIFGIRQQAGDVKDIYYKINMELKNLRTGELDWADEKQIRKKSTKKTFGW